MNCVTWGFWSGVSSASACSGDEAFSGPDEKSISVGFRGVVKAGFPKTGAGFRPGGCEKRNGCELGSRRAGVEAFWGESKTLREPGQDIISYWNESKELEKWYLTLQIVLSFLLWHGEFVVRRGGVHGCLALPLEVHRTFIAAFQHARDLVEGEHTTWRIYSLRLGDSV